MRRLIAFGRENDPPLVAHPAEGLTPNSRLKRIRALSPRVDFGHYCIYGRVIDPPLRQCRSGAARKLGLEVDGGLAGLLQRSPTPNRRTSFNPNEPSLQQQSAVIPAYVGIPPVVLQDSIP